VLIPLDFEKGEIAERFVKHLGGVIRDRAAEEAAQRQKTAANGLGGSGGGRRGSGGGSGGGATGGGAAPGGGGGGGFDGTHTDLDLPFELHMLEVALGEVRGGDGRVGRNRDELARPLQAAADGKGWTAHAPRCARTRAPARPRARAPQVCRHLAQQVAALEALAHPALDALTRNADTVNLERVGGFLGGTGGGNAFCNVDGGSRLLRAAGCCPCARAAAAARPRPAPPQPTPQIAAQTTALSQAAPPTARPHDSHPTHPRCARSRRSTSGWGAASRACGRRWSAIWVRGPRRMSRGAGARRGGRGGGGWRAFMPIPPPGPFQ
jgi:hypothetical protein